MEDVAPPGARGGVEGPAAAAVVAAAPEAAAHLAAVRAVVADGPDRDVVALASARIAQLLGAGEPAGTAWAASVAGGGRTAALRGWPDDPVFDERDRACLAFTEQFVLDVASVDDAQRGALAAVLGPAAAGAFTVALFVVDMGTRLDLALDRLVGDGGEPDAGVGGPSAVPTRVPDPAPVVADGAVDGAADGAGGGGLYGALDRFWRDVARLDRIDPVTTELVRLRSARHHNCRLCRSTRSLAALEAGVTPDVLDRAEAGEPVDLGAAQRAALDVVDAVITQPGGMSADLVARARVGWSTPQLVELVLDVVRNSGQKIAVALGADDPHVASGTELFTVGADGVVTFLGEAPVP